MRAVRIMPNLKIYTNIIQLSITFAQVFSNRLCQICLLIIFLYNPSKEKGYYHVKLPWFILFKNLGRFIFELRILYEYIGSYTIVYDMEEDSYAKLYLLQPGKDHLR